MANLPTFDKVPGYNLYIGGFIALRRPQALARCRITHIISVIDWRFDHDSPPTKGYNHLHIPVDDVDDENLITWFPKANRFIEAGLRHRNEEKGDPSYERQQEVADFAKVENGVLVHCAMGKSRSATIILAYLLWDSQRRYSSKHVSEPTGSVPLLSRPLDVVSALALLREGRPIAEPNDGFMDQLALYHAIGCPDEVDGQPRYERWLYQRMVQESLSVNRAPEIQDVRFEDEHTDLSALDRGSTASLSIKASQVTGASQSSTTANLEIKCRKCRRLLARDDFFAEHKPLHGEDPKACAHVFLHPLSWMKEALGDGLMDGRLTCPNARCRANIGKYAWQGLKCSCGGWVTPGFGLARARIDEVTPGHTMSSALLPKASHADDSRSFGESAVRLPPSLKRIPDENL